MKRLNPLTGNPFKAGDAREDGLIFRQYIKRIQPNGYFRESWLRQEVFEKIKANCASYCKEQYPKNRLTKIERSRQRRANYPDIIAKQKKASYEANKIHCLAQKKTYRQNNKGKINALVSYRKKAIKQRTPMWLDIVSRAEIEFTYVWCSSLRACNMDYHVDHIVPLRGETVSGLHVPWNLQVIPAFDNISKRNRWIDG